MRKRRSRRLPDKVRQIKTPRGYVPTKAYRSVRRGYTAVYFERRKK